MPIPQPISVLLVEDDLGHVELISRAFASRPEGFALQVARSVDEAVRLVAEVIPDLLIADLHLPDGKGTELLSLATTEPAFPSMALTSQGNETEAVEAMKAGALDYIVKSARSMVELPHVARHVLREWEHLRKRTEAEQALRKAHDELDQKVRDRTSELTVANAHLREEVELRKHAERRSRRQQEMLRRLLTANERERQLIAYEIHDGLAQQLTGARMQFQAAEPGNVPDSVETKAAFAAGMSLLDNGIAEARRLISGLRPPVLDEAGLGAAIKHLVAEVCERQGIAIELSIDFGTAGLEPLLENAIFRIVQEALTNVCRHSQSKKAKVVLQKMEEDVIVTVQDWGVGFDVGKKFTTRFGIRGMQERAQVLGGRLRIESTLCKGTRIQAQFPFVLSQPPSSAAHAT